ncbi:serine/threonine protein kinase [Penicillium capsulatum]|uniref:Serine/threonine protein kinase n=1 Tax=Penicillium capsulatum TaxID=69766 RepID=A0A9W9LQY3_9EURO|nr:serine/threonine protein kinase [Penicillium capsulatum]
MVSYATASEVTTLTFLRSKGIPVPTVYGWSSTTVNPVSVEYIIMEEASGGQPYQPGIPDEDRDSDTYWIGPIADYMFWYGQRIKFELDRGPCMLAAELKCPIIFDKLIFVVGSDPRKYLLVIAKKEIKWTEQFGKPLECEFPHNTVFPGVNSHQDYLELLKKYLAIAPYLLPQDPLDILNRILTPSPQRD